MRKKVLPILIVMLLATIQSLSVQGQELGLGVAFKASTLGLGGDAILGINDKMVVRVGMDGLGLKRNLNDFPDLKEELEGSLDGLSLDADVQVRIGSVSALYDYYLTKNIFVTGGLLIDRFKVSLKGEANKGLPFGDIEIPKEDVGTFDFDITPSWKVSPYLGVGFGRSLGYEKKFGFAFELGALYQGAPNIDIATTGVLEPTSAPDQVETLEGQFSQYTIWPVLKFSVSYRIMDLKF